MDPSLFVPPTAEEQLDLLLGSNAEDDDDDITDTDTDRSTPVRQMPIDLVGSAQAASSLDTDLMSRTAPVQDGTVPSVLHQSPPSPPPLVRERSSEKEKREVLHEIDAIINDEALLSAWSATKPTCIRHFTNLMGLMLRYADDADITARGATAALRLLEYALQYSEGSVSPPSSVPASPRPSETDQTPHHSNSISSGLSAFTSQHNLSAMSAATAEEPTPNSTHPHADAAAGHRGHGAALPRLVLPNPPSADDLSCSPSLTVASATAAAPSTGIAPPSPNHSVATTLSKQNGSTSNGSIGTSAMGHADSASSVNTFSGAIRSAPALSLGSAATIDSPRSDRVPRSPSARVTITVARESASSLVELLDAVLTCRVRYLPNKMLVAKGTDVLLMITERMLKLMETFPHDALIQSEGCTIIGRLAWANANGVVSERLRTLGGSEFIIAAMRNHSSDARLQEMACLALGSLAFCSAEHRTNILSTFGLNTLVASMKRHNRDPHVQAKACYALYFLDDCDDAVERKMRSLDVVGATKMALQNFPSSSSPDMVRYWALQLLDKLS